MTKREEMAFTEVRVVTPEGERVLIRAVAPGIVTQVSAICGCSLDNYYSSCVYMRGTSLFTCSISQ